ncbi:hypothetical protein BH23BAC1_BH23BAC1_16060 [soil metagenome]
MNQLVKLILSSLSLLAVIIINYLSNTEVIGPQEVGEVSQEYDTLITPAGYAFAIWGLIYVLLILFTIYQWYVWHKNKEPELINRIGLWYFLANVANACWVIAWVNDYIGLSVILMLVLIFSLIQMVIRLDQERWDAPFSIIFFVWWPITIYFGWIVLATVLNISAFLVSLGWQGGFLAPQVWAIIMIIASSVIYVFLTYTRNMREAAVVGIWGLIAIASRQWDFNPEITFTALGTAGILLIYTFFHAYKNRKALPFFNG